MSTTSSGMSAKRLERELGVTYKTAWRMVHLFRDQLMATDHPDEQPMFEQLLLRAARSAR